MCGGLRAQLASIYGTIDRLGKHAMALHASWPWLRGLHVSGRSRWHIRPRVVLCGGAAPFFWCGACRPICEHGEEQVANAGPQRWDYCAPKPNYADVRKRVGNAFAEKAHEIADAIAVVQGLSKESSRLLRGVVVMFVFA